MQTILAIVNLIPLVVAPVMLPPPTHTIPDERHKIYGGVWSQFNQGPTDGQIWYHTTQTRLLKNPKQYDGFIAVADCKLVGDEAWIKVYPWKRWHHVFIFDCSGHASTTRWFHEAGIIGELGWYIARSLEVPVGQGVKGEITFSPPAVIRVIEREKEKRIERLMEIVR